MSSNRASPVPSGQTLSKNAMYAPLIAYDQGNNEDPSLYMVSRKKIPNSIRDSALIDFLHSVSVEYHRNSNTRHGKNNGSRPQSRQDVEGCIQQRALTLIGGGINTKMGKKKPASTKKQRVISNRQRKKHLLQRDAMSPRNDNPPGPSQTTVDETELLMTLNGKWKNYVTALIPKGLGDMDKLDSLTMGKLSSRLAAAELIGAIVKITKCSAHKKWIGKEGLIMGVTVNTWRLVLLSKTDKPSSHRGIANPPSTVPTVSFSKVLVVPRKGSQISFPVSLASTPLDATSSRTLTVLINGSPSTLE